MGVLAGVLAPAVAGLVAVAGCYSPSLRDCTVTCSAESDCAAGQVCGDDGLCAGPDLAGHCSAPMPAPDAGPGPGSRPDAAIAVDAGPAIDAAPPPDAPAFVALRIQIDGKGTVFVDGRFGCSSTGPQKGDCTYDVARGVAQTIRAVSMPDPFLSWTSVTCRGTNPVCTVTPTVSVIVVAKFGKAGGPGGL
jgi:hypothetical protein